MIMAPNTFVRGSGGLITGSICLKFGRRHFPSRRWNDFVSVILMWWTEVLLRGNNQVQECYGGYLTFMDGPYEILIARNGDKTRFRCVRTGRPALTKLRGVVRWDELKGNIIHAASVLLAHAAKEGWSSREITAIRKNLALMGEAVHRGDSRRFGPGQNV